MTDHPPEYAGFWIRTVAVLIDTLALLLILLPLLIAIYGLAYLHPSRTDPAGLADTLLLWGLPLVLTIAFWLYKQATPGKMAVAIKVVDAKTGGTLSFDQAVGRYAGYFISGVPLGLGFIWAAFDPRKQGWHDKLAGTVVVRSAHPDQGLRPPPDSTRGPRGGDGAAGA